MSKNLSGYTFEQYSYKIVTTFDDSPADSVELSPKNKRNVSLYSGKVFEISATKSKITFLNSSGIPFFSTPFSTLFFILL